MEKNIWSVKDMFEYAIQSYELDLVINLDDSEKDNIQKAIRRNLSLYNLVDTINNDNDTSEKTQKKQPKSYRVYDVIGRCLIDYIMHDYFIKLIDTHIPEKEKAYIKHDNKLNEDSINRHEMLEDADMEYECAIYDQEQTERDIDRFMLRAIFDMFYDFDYEQYCSDAKKRFELYDFDAPVTPYMDGFSKIDDKLNHPIKNYCTRKK